MSKNLQKTLAGALATMSVMSIATPVMATTVDIDALYKNAYDAMRKAQETKTQTDINAAMKLIWELRHIGDERKDENLINAACTWSSLVDEVQHPKLVKIVTAITKAQEKGDDVEQADINEAFATIEPELPEDWRSSYTSAIDLVQQKLIDKATNATEDAEKAYKAFEKDKNEDNLKKAKDALNEAKKLVENLSTSVNEDAKNWANNVLKVKLDVINLEDVKLYGLKITGATFDKAGVKVNFDALEQSLDDVTLTVLDNNGKEVKVKSIATIKKGATEAKFAFNNYLSERPTGVWTINEEKFDLTEVNFVEDVKANLGNGKLNEVLEKEEYKGLVTYNTKRVENYAKKLQKAELKKVKDIQDVIDKVNAELDKQESSNSEKNKYINLIKEVSKNGNQEQFNNALNQGVEAKYIKDVNPDYMEDYKKEIKSKGEDVKEIADIQTQIKNVNDRKQQEADQKNEAAKTALIEALEGNDKKAILDALQNSFLGLDNVKAENIDHYVLDKENIKHKLEKHTGLEKVNEYLNMINEKADVVNANTLENMIKALGKFSQTRNFGDFNNLSTVKKQDTAEELLRNISSQEKQYSIGDLEKEIVKINKDIKDKLENLNVALDGLKKERKEKKAVDLTLPLRNALEEIIGQEVGVEKADKFYEASVNNKGELTSYTNYTQVRTVFNGLK